MYTSLCPYLRVLPVLHPPILWNNMRRHAFYAPIPHRPRIHRITKNQSMLGIGLVRGEL